ncbi:glycosyl transferase [Sphingobacterium mizutaii NBRC 14946 = DSM 11724]|uniref:Undecaprenyl phosphate 4-deoxy-4-formamido-L-arabinose transferase n=2 Tax=Sphingobacterium mizutaii TaxID=1010 RepID=A0AAJ4X877_9SPHI|nr:glycosyltransferase family 2 protein [Sphingobacterium mizutaii]GEM68033.1 glycosyl transferase [Sphingobacterium mizutaii NBRC 14946 = DSM 11724]SDL77925.1 Glycosyl transferase family 2 [Sphingobacterium mizutaii]SNV38003.1 undecaprenyl phosphate 4-deoxy-4-formamido-L-arabinose transferase [Sphingobacterium mizutaii]
MKDKVHVIVPVFNEDPEVLKETLHQLILKDYIVVLVDDGSLISASSYLEDYPIHHLRHIVNLGQGAALQTGISYSISIGGSVFATFDADGQHDPDDIERMVTSLTKDEVDIVLGSRFLENKSNIGWQRRLILQLARVINFIFTGVFMTDSHNGLRVFNLKGARLFIFKENRMAHATEILINLSKEKVAFQEYPVNITYSEYSKRKGQKNIDSLVVLKDLIFHKIFQ